MSPAEWARQLQERFPNEVIVGLEGEDTLVIYTTRVTMWRKWTPEDMPEGIEKVKIVHITPPRPA
jgi:hypothetical protein